MNGIVILNSSFDATGYHHRSRLTTDFPQCHDLGVKVVNHNLSLEANSVVVAFHVMAQFLMCPFNVKFGVILDF